MSKPTVTPRRPSGFNEYLPAEQIEFNRIVDVIKNTYEKYGYSPIETPDLELSDVLLAKSGGETAQQVYQFARGKNDLCMRFDLTVPLARYVAEHEGQLVFPFRRYHIGKVHRAERAQAGRFREFYQADIDVIGSDNPLLDAEMPAVINDIFGRLNFGEFVIRLNNRMVLNGFFASIGLEDVSAEVLRIVDKIDKISSDDFAHELKSLNLNDEQVKKVIWLTEINGSNDEILGQLNDLDIGNIEYKDGVSKLRQIVSALRQMKVPEHRFKIDLRIARGLDYYTGTVYETNLIEYPELGSVASGGRYDNLAESYTKSQLPGVGISIGLSRLFYKLLELGVVAPSQQSLAEVIVLPVDANAINASFEVATVLRQNDIATIVYSESDSMKRKFRYADRMGVKLVVIIGEDEMRQGSVTIKDMATSESIVGGLDDVIAKFKS